MLDQVDVERIDLAWFEHGLQHVVDFDRRHLWWRQAEPFRDSLDVGVDWQCGAFEGERAGRMQRSWGRRPGVT